MAMSDFQASSLGRAQPMLCVYGPAELGNTWPGPSSMVSWMHQWPKLNPVGFQETPLMKEVPLMDLQPHSCDSFHFVLLRVFVKQEHLFSAGRQD